MRQLILLLFTAVLTACVITNPAPATPTPIPPTATAVATQIYVTVEGIEGALEPSPMIALPETAVIPPAPTATPTHASAEPSAGTLLLYTVVTTPTATAYWSLTFWPATPPFTEDLFATFYGRTTHADDMRLYFFNFRPQLSPDGRYLLLPSVGGYGRPPQDESIGLWLVDLVDGHLRRLLSRPVVAAWSPDSRQIAYVQDNTLYTRALDETAEPQPIFTHPDLASVFVDWSPDGRHLAVMTISQGNPDDPDYTGPNGTVWLVPPDGAAPRQLSPAIPLALEMARSELAWSPDGRYLLAANTVLDTAGNVTTSAIPGAA